MDNLEEFIMFDTNEEHTFSGTVGDEISIPLDGLYLHLECMGPSISIVYITTRKDNHKIDLPAEFVGYTYDFQDLKKRVLLEKVRGEGNTVYILCPTDHYEFEYKNKPVLTLHPKQTWTITYH